MSLVKILTGFLTENLRGRVGYPKQAALLTKSKLIKVDLTKQESYSTIERSRRDLRAIFYPTGEEWYGLLDLVEGRKEVEAFSFRGVVAKAKNLLKKESLPTGVEAAIRLEGHLASFDWNWSMSEDRSVIVKARRDMDAIEALLPRVSVRTAKKLWVKYAPKGVPFPSTV